MEIDYGKLVDSLLRKMTVTQKHGPGTTPTTIYGHDGPYGQAGAFSFPGLERDVVNAMIMPRLGLLDLLTSRTANTTDPLYGIITGVTASSGSEPTGPCIDPKYAGLMKMCTHSFVFGRFSRMTRVFELDRFGKIRDRSDFLDLNLIGDPLAAGMNPWMPTSPTPGSDPALALRSELAKALFEFAVAWGRDVAGQLYTGNPTNNIDEGYKEPYGLDLLINTGYRDAESGVACPAADSIVQSFGNKELTDNCELAVRTITYIYRNLRFIAERAGLMPVRWVLAMPWALFYELTECWPCAYLSYRCKIVDTSKLDATPFINASDQTAMRDGMRQGSYLLIDGEQVPVVTDDAIPVTTVAGGSLISDVYFVPITVLGGRPVTYLEYMNYDAAGGAMDGARLFAPTGSYFTTNGGRFLWHAKPPTNFCVQMLAKMEWRVILETPHLAGRLVDIKYTPLIHQRSPFPSDTSYFVDGGGTNRDAKDLSYYTPTA